MIRAEVLEEVAAEMTLTVETQLFKVIGRRFQKLWFKDKMDLRPLLRTIYNETYSSWIKHMVVNVMIRKFAKMNQTTLTLHLFLTILLLDIGKSEFSNNWRMLLLMVMTPKSIGYQVHGVRV